MKRHEKPDLTILHPLPDAVARALLDASHESSVVDDAVEDLPPHERVQAGQGGGGRVGVLRRGSRAIVTHRASERASGDAVWCSDCRDGWVLGSGVTSGGSGDAHIWRIKWCCRCCVGATCAEGSMDRRAIFWLITHSSRSSSSSKRGVALLREMAGGAHALCAQ